MQYPCTPGVNDVESNDKAVSQPCSREQECTTGRLRGYDGSLLFSTDFSSLHHSSVVECVPDVIPYCLSQQRIATTPQLKAPPLTPRDVGDEDDEEEHLREQHVVFYI